MNARTCSVGATSGRTEELELFVQSSCECVFRNDKQHLRSRADCFERYSRHCCIASGNNPIPPREYLCDLSSEYPNRRPLKSRSYSASRRIPDFPAPNFRSREKLPLEFAQM